MKNKIKIKALKSLFSFLGTSFIPLFSISCNSNNPKSIEIIGPDEIYQHETPNYKANVLPTSAEQKVVWETDKHEIAIIDQETGTLTPIGYGKVIIFATSVLDSKILSTKIVNIKPAQSKITIVGSQTITVGYPQKYKAIVEPAEASQHVNWKLIWDDSDPDVATIDEEGNLLLKKLPSGTKKIILQAWFEDQSKGYVTLEINIVGKPTSVEITKYPQKISTNDDPFKCEAKCFPEGTKQDVVWSVNDATIAKVDDEGNIKGLKEGSVELTATSLVDSNVKQSVSVNVEGEIAKPFDFETDSWETIANCLSEGIESLRDAYKDTESYKKNGSFLGLTRQLQIGDATYHIMVVGEAQDMLYGSENQKASLTFEFVEPIVLDLSGRSYFKTEYQENKSKSLCWYESSGESCKVYKFLNNIFKQQIDNAMGFSEETSLIKVVEKKTYGHSSSSKWELVKSPNSVFLPSIAEIYNHNQLKSLKKDSQYEWSVLPNNYDDYMKENERYQWYDQNTNSDIQLAPNAEGFPTTKNIPPFQKTYFSFLEKSKYWYRTVSKSNKEKVFYYNGETNNFGLDTYSNAECISPFFCI